MTRFCGTCGAPLGDSATFCGACGARSQVGAQPVQAVGQPPASIPPPAPVSKGSNTAIKVVIAVVVVLGLGGLLAVAGMIYAAHKISQKTHSIAQQVLRENGSSTQGGLGSLLNGAGSQSDDGVFKGDPCRFLSKEDVSHAVGVEIVKTRADGPSCSYIAHGDPADMTSKHMASMAAGQASAKGESIDPKTQKMMQQIAGTFFKQQESSDKDLAAQAATGEVTILALSFTTQGAELAMKMNKAAFNHITHGTPLSGGEASTAQTGTGDLSGLGDEAYEMGGTGLAVRKGSTMVQMMFPQCPCNADTIKPLAEKIVSQL